MEENCKPMISIDDFIEKNGEEFDEAKSTIVSSNDIFDSDTKKLAYDDATILPGKATKFDKADDVAMTAENAKNKIIQDLAMEKLKIEMDRMNKLSDEAKIKEYVFQMEMRRAMNNFYANNHYEMPGSQKRNVKRQIERAYKAGKYKLTPEQKQDILYELNKASNDVKEQSRNSLNASKEPITSLDSLIKPI